MRICTRRTTPSSRAGAAWLIGIISTLWLSVAAAEVGVCPDCTPFVAYDGADDTRTLVDWSELDASATKVDLDCWNATASWSGDVSKSGASDVVVAPKPTSAAATTCVLTPNVGAAKNLEIVSTQ